jgi:hypothetical protein
LVADETKGFSITLEPGWNQLPKRSDFSDTFLRVSSPAGVDKGALYVQIFNRGSYTPESYRAAVRRYVTETMKGEILSESTPVINGKPAWQLQYAGESVGYAEDRRYFLNTVVFQKERIVVVHCATKQGLWETLKGSCLKMSQTLKLEGE